MGEHTMSDFAARHGGRRCLPILRTFMLLAAALVAGAHAAEIEVDLRDEQLNFLQACHTAGYTSASQYGDCIERASNADNTEQDSTLLHTAWLRACGLTYGRFTDRASSLTDLAFYAKACKQYQTQD